MEEFTCSKERISHSGIGTNLASESSAPIIVRIQMSVERCAGAVCSSLGGDRPFKAVERHQSASQTV